MRSVLLGELFDAFASFLVFELLELLFELLVLLDDGLAFGFESIDVTLDAIEVRVELVAVVALKLDGVLFGELLDERTSCARNTAASLSDRAESRTTL